MSDTLVDKIARAVLYEGYVLYPYRPSVKTRQRWTFGGVFPREWSKSHRFGDSPVMQAQCLLRGNVPQEIIAGGGSPGSSSAGTGKKTGASVTGHHEQKPPRISLTLRFLHLTDRTIEQGPDFHPVPSLRVGERELQSWQEAVEREVRIENLAIADLLASARIEPFEFPATRQVEPIDGASPPARLARQQQVIAGNIEISATPLAPAALSEPLVDRDSSLDGQTPRQSRRAPVCKPEPSGSVAGYSRETNSAEAPGPASSDLIRLTVRVTNLSPLDAAATRDLALLQSLASTHLILTAEASEFASLTDPPAELADWAGQCQNIGCWPVLVGAADQADTLLCSPIILPDYPQIAPESPGDLFDGTEIDEILTLRILTLTDEEKRHAAATDDRVATLLARTEGLAREQLANLHGAMREAGEPARRVSPGSTGVPRGAGPPARPGNSYDPLADRAALEKTLGAGIELKPGDRVRLHPRKNADVFDLALAGRTATIAAIEQDLENRIHLAVTVDDDPGKDLGAAGKIGHRFFFSPEEVEVLP